MTMRMTSANWDSQQNGAFSPSSRTPSGSVSSRSQINGGFSSSHKMSLMGRGSSNKSSLVYDSAAAIKNKSALELGSGVLQSVSDTSFIKLVQWIRAERLSTLPHQGSTWDTVLIRSLYVAERLHKFETAIQGFASGTNAAAEVAYSHIRLLLELGHENSDALDKAFGLFYKSALTISSLIDRSELLSCTNEVQEQLCHMYTDLVAFVVEVAVYFYKTVQSMADREISLDLYEVFGETLEITSRRRAHIANLIWSYQIGSEADVTEDALSIDTLVKWLSPQDRVLEMLGSDHTTFADQLAERTGLWFQENLTNFVKGSNECLLLTGPAGSGKTSLSAAMTERLQRPIARQNLSTIFVSIGAVQSEATALHVVKSILSQLLTHRVGNLALYHALVNAYHESRRTADPQAYEDHLWNALVEALQRPLDGANSTIIIVDGIDEVQGGQSAGQQLLEKLTKSVGRGKRTKFIGLSQALSLPSGARGQTYKIAPEDTRDDIHTVAIRSLAKVSLFAKKPGHEQETIIATILDAAKGSFLWTILFSESLRPEKSPETFEKTLQTLKSSPPSVTDLVGKLLTTLQPTPESRLLLSWLTVTARPLTNDEISCLLTVKPETAEVTSTPANLTSVIAPISPLLSVKRDVVRPRHGLVTSTLQTLLQPLIDQGKISMPHKNRQIDFLLRSLTYASSVLPKDVTPTLDNSDYTLPTKLFSKFPLLEYTIRYWTLHFGQTPFAPTGSSAPKLPDEFKKAFPSSPAMPVLEWICWDDQFPGSQEVDLHTLVCRVRSEILTQNHPSVMQSFINTAAYYVPMGNDREATKSYYYAVTIGQTVLGPANPVTVEVGNRFLVLSSQMTSTTRTEIMTQRERVLQVLITAYEKQFGSTSELVINTRQQLIDLYQQINETDKIETLVTQQNKTGYAGNDYGRYGNVDGGVKDSLGGKLRRKSGKQLGQIGPIFEGVHDGDEDIAETLDLARVSQLLQQARSLDSQQKYEASEEIYVDLWYQLSTICRTTLSTDWHQQKLEAVETYSKSLQQQKRSTEASSALILIAEEYRNHELFYRESIINKLSSMSQSLKKEHKTAYLSLAQQIVHFRKNVQKVDSRESRELEESVAEVTREVVNQQKDSNQATVSKSTQLHLFMEHLMNKSTTIDSSTITRVQQQSKQFMESHQYEQAVEIITLTLQRTWSSFLAETLNSVSISTSFLQENLVLIDQLAQAYLAQRKIEKAIDVYLRLFRAALTSPKEHKDLLEKTKVTLIGLYDKYGYPDRSISILQEVLAVYSRINGPNHELTIATLYELGIRTRQNARTHPYWIEYYQQIVTALTKESKAVDAKSFEAADILATQYWAERRYIDATGIFSLLWNTFVNKTKSIQQLSDETFAQTLYERYRQSLEATQVDQETIIRTTEEFQKTAKVQFGASSAISQLALSAYNQVCQYYASSSSESRQLSILQEMIQNSSSSSDKSYFLKEKTRILRRKLTEQKDVSSETVNEARSLFSQQLQECYASYGYKDESTLSSLKELSMLEFRQNKTEDAMKSINSAVTEITTTEVTQEQAMKAAQSIAEIFQASQQTLRSQELIQELRIQIVAQEKRAGSRASFDITQKSTSSALMFLASLEYHLRSDLSLTWSEIFAELLAERRHYLNFRKVTSNKSGLDKIVIAAAPLRHFLQKRERTQQAQSLEQQIVALFVQRDLSGFNLEAKNTSPTVFIVGILDFLGSKSKPDFVRAVIIATNRTISKLIAGNKFAEAYDVANVGFKYAQVHKGYELPGAISMGFGLASQLDGRNENRCPDESLRKKLLQLSNSIVKEILKICKAQEINLAQVQLTELNELIALLGEQEDYVTLEELLTTLWNTREAQRSWPSEALLNLGQRLVCARYLAGHPVKAIRLGEDISYNLRRAHGISHPATLESFQTLAQLYTSTGQFYQKNAASDKSAAMLAADYFKKAILVEEDILRWFVSESSGGEDDEDDTAASILAEHGVKPSGPADQTEEQSVDRSAEVKTHLNLLKLAYQRYGQWPKNYAVYEQLNADIFAQFGAALKGLEGTEKWTVKGFGAGNAESIEGAFAVPKQWDILLN